MKHFLHFLLLLFTVNLAAQAQVIKGEVSDKNFETLPGVAILVKGANRGTITDINGKYSIPVSLNDTLVFSFVGMQTKEVVVEEGQVYDIVMEYSTDVLDEAVVIGYGTVNKSDLTGAVSSIKAKEITKNGTMALDQALAGKAAGVIVNSTSGVLGAGATIKIRGINSMTGSEPLYVIDGIPMDNTDVGTLSDADESSASLSPLSLINPSDIESIEILKDASATAIYGSRGANGVVLITTKSGETGKGKINVSTEFGYLSLTKQIDVMDANEFWLNRETAFENAGNIINAREQELVDSARDGLLETINWQDYVLQNGTFSNTNISFSGGTKDLRYLVSGNFYDATGQVPGTGISRISGRLNLRSQVNSKLSVGTNLTYALIDADQQSTNTNVNTINGLNSVINRALFTAPTVGLNASDEDEGVDTYLPTTAISANSFENKVYQFLGSVYGEIELLKGLRFKTTLTYQGRTTEQRFYQKNLFLNAQREGWARTGSSSYLSTTNTNLFTYVRKINRNRLNIVLGQSAEWRSSESLRTSNYGFVNDYLGYYGLGSPEFSDPDDISYSDSRLASFFTRANYSINNKYLLTLTARYDGSSKFAANNKWALFPAAAVAYKISNERFMRKLKSISTTKIRLSYGLVGNQALQPYQSLDQLTNSQMGFGDETGDEGLAAIYYANQLANQNLKWETTAQLNVGLDMGFFKDRYNLTVDYYVKRTSDLLVVGNAIPSHSGFSTYTENFGLMETKGLDLGLEAHIVSKTNFDWTTNATVSVGKTIIAEMNSDYIQSGYNQGWVAGGTQRLIIGEEIGAFYGYRTAGIAQFDDFQEFQGLTAQQQIDLYNEDPTKEFTPVIPDGEEIGRASTVTGPGQQLYEDLNNDGVIDDLDKQVIGHAQPDIAIGLNNSFSFYNFEFSFFIDCQLGQEIVNVTNFRLLDFSGGQQLGLVADEAWSPENQNNNYPRVNQNNAGSPNFVFSDRFIEDASFVRLQNITLGYNIPSKLSSKLKVDNVRVFASVTNLITLSTYSGYNPDVSLNGRNTQRIGHDNAGQPLATIWRGGISVNF